MSFLNIFSFNQSADVVSIAVEGLANQAQFVEESQPYPFDSVFKTVGVWIHHSIIFFLNENPGSQELNEKAFKYKTFLFNTSTVLLIYSIFQVLIGLLTLLSAAIPLVSFLALRLAVSESFLLLIEEGEPNNIRVPLISLGDYPLFYS